MRYTRGKPAVTACILAGLFLLAAMPASGAVDKQAEDKGYGAAEARKVVKQPERWTTADHSHFKELQQEFDSGPEVTKACLSCHNEAGDQVQETIHWTWRCPADPTGRMGKGGITLNNF